RGDDPEQNRRDTEPVVHGVIRSEGVEDRPVVQVSHETKDLPSSDRSTSTPRPAYAGVMHRTHSVKVRGHVAWLKRLWDQLVGQRRSSVALFALPRSRSSHKAWPSRHYLSGAAPGNAAG